MELYWLACVLVCARKTLKALQTTKACGSMAQEIGNQRRRSPQWFVNSACLVVCLIISGLVNAPRSVADETRSEVVGRPLVLAHYMPWYTAEPFSPSWGWHWTMNHFDPETIVDERRQVASHYYPLAGPYDSGDPAIIEYHLLLMKLAGIDGIIVDWYGLTDLHDYATLHRNTKAVVQQVERMNMRFVICYEDQTVSPLIKAGRITVAQSTEHVAKEIDWMVRNWFSRPSYVRIGDRPVMLSFGNVGLSGEQWTACLKSLQALMTCDCHCCYCSSGGRYRVSSKRSN